jgi:hypothetical protein
VVNQGGLRFIEGLPAASVELQAQIDIVERDREPGLIKSTNRYEFFARYDQTCGSDCAHSLREACSAEITRFIDFLKTVRVTRTATDPCKDSCMLNGTIRIQESRAHCPDVAAHRVHDH